MALASLARGLRLGLRLGGFGPLTDTLAISAGLLATLLSPRLRASIFGRGAPSRPNPRRLPTRFAAVAAEGMRRRKQTLAVLQ